MRIEIDTAPGLIKPFLNSGRVSEARGEDAVATDLTEIALPLELDVTDATGGLSNLDPNLRQQLQHLSGDETGLLGERRNFKGKCRDLTIVIGYDQDPEVFKQCSCSVRSVSLETYQDGDAKLRIKAAIKATDDEERQLSKLVGADVVVSLRPTQVDIADSEPDQPKTRIRAV